ncbi:RNA-directed DNA polymerase (reversetranscriptase)-related family protein [Striga asiatica]|uniref:RNA-directed DNA polymerase (Reversetranscriptase)-related family protein n=1 Tax=Striga asiatica TaxID=4170 RepID=A0A5A7P6N8_STRAF|nr:RNA-directed DNA polymerase (reversetranscriptase)-related family protein [Striga asiatica]
MFQTHLDTPESSSSKKQLRRMWKVTWALKIKHKLKHFLWRVLHNAIPTSHNLWLRKCQSQQSCRLCGEDSESLEHIFFSCERASLVWKIAPVSWDCCNIADVGFTGWRSRICEAFLLGLTEAFA